MKQVTFPLSVSGIERLQRSVEEYQRWLKDRSEKLLDRLAEEGYQIASAKFAQAVYDGTNDVFVSTENRGANIRAVVAVGSSVLFIEFGSGVTYGYGHPEANQYGMGPGTYPEGKGHWDDPRGWHLPKEKGGGHTYGNPPAMPMYEARKAIEQELPRIVREVFTGD